MRNQQFTLQTMECILQKMLSLSTDYYKRYADNSEGYDLESEEDYEDELYDN